MSIITVVGAGQMGSAIAIPAAENGHTLRLVGTPLDREIIEHARKTGYHLNLKRQLHPSFTYYQIEQLDEALQGADLLIGGVSSFGVDWFVENILTRIPESLPVLSITKGLWNDPDGTLIDYPAYYARKLEVLAPGRTLSLNAVGGPCTSYELADHDPTEVCFCGRDPELLRWMRGLFERDYYHISLSTDVAGVECAVALKNAYALGVTLAVGLSERREGKEGVQHYNSQAALFGQSIREMRRLIALVGGQDDNIVYGAGDLYVTIYGGRTRRIGTLLGRGLSFDEAMAQLKGVTLESIVIAARAATAVQTLIARGVLRADDFPLLNHINEIITQGKPVDIPWAAFTTESFLEERQ